MDYKDYKAQCLLDDDKEKLSHYTGEEIGALVEKMREQKPYWAKRIHADWKRARAARARALGVKVEADSQHHEEHTEREDEDEPDNSDGVLEVVVLSPRTDHHIVNEEKEEASDVDADEVDAYDDVTCHDGSEESEYDYDEDVYTGEYVPETPPASDNDESEESEDEAWENAVSEVVEPCACPDTINQLARMEKRLGTIEGILIRMATLFGTLSGAGIAALLYYIYVRK